MANAIQKISKRAKAIRRAHPSKAWAACIKQASAEYKRGKLGATLTIEKGESKRTKPRKVVQVTRSKAGTFKKSQTVAGAKSMLVKWHKDMLANALLKRETATTKREKREWSKKAAHLKRELKKFQ